MIAVFLPYAHEVIPRGYSELRVLKEGMFEDLSLANKQLRFVLRFLMVCLLLNRREMVQQLLNQLGVLVDEYKRTFQPWVMKRETVIGKKNCHQILTEVGLTRLEREKGQRKAMVTLERWFKSLLEGRIRPLSGLYD